jgi:hypothetical protein
MVAGVGFPTIAVNGGKTAGVIGVVIVVVGTLVLLRKIPAALGGAFEEKGKNLVDVCSKC